MQTIETQRLLLRNVTLQDGSSLFTMLGDEQTCLDDGGYHACASMEDPGFLQNLKWLAEHDQHYLVVEKGAGQEPAFGQGVGLIHLMDAHRGVPAMELGYIISRNFRRQGYAREALSGVIAHLFATGIRMVTAECYAYNLASRRLLESLGFAQEGVRRKALLHPQRGVIDTLLFCLEGP